MGEVPAGWYDDGAGALRYYDGAAWTEHVAGVPALPTPASGPRKRFPAWGWVLIAAGVVIIIGGLVAAGFGVYNSQQTKIAEAKEAIETYDAAWRDADCDTLAEATTYAMRVDWGYDDCDAFVADAKAFDESSRTYTTKVRSAKLSFGDVIVKTTESYIDEDGTPFVDWVTYTIVKDGDVWRIDQIEFADSDSDSAGTQDA